MEDTITLTQAELDTRIQEAVDTATKDLISKHNSDMAKMRKENTDLRNASKSQEQLKQEQDQALQDELTELRNFKKGKVIEERLAKESLPSYFKNDARLLNAKEEDFDRVLKEVKKEYEGTLPNGNTHSSVVQTNSGATPPQSDKDKANAEMGAVLTSMFGNN